MATSGLWPWQQRGLEEVLHRLDQGELSICVTAPTGMGKGRMIEELALKFIELGGRVGLFTNRKMLTRQTGKRFRQAGIKFGYAAASEGMDTSNLLTIVSLQTLTSRVKRAVMNLPHFDLLIIDEAHNRGFAKATALYRAAHPNITVVGFTATPVGLLGQYQTLVQAGTKAEGRLHDALVRCRVFSPSEPDMQGVKMTAVGEYEHKGMTKRVMECTVFADIFDTWEKRGGPTRPTLCWAPDISSSKWVKEQFNKRGVTAEHIDGDTEEAERLRIEEGSKSGAIRVVCSCGVLREGVDWPWVEYGILLQVCGAIETFVQTVGRILRASPGKHDAVLQDHSGTWWRHGSPNDDIDWKLEDTNKSIAAKKKKDKEDGNKEEGVRCPSCGGIRLAGPECPHCGFKHSKSVRAIRMVDGQLAEMTGPVVTKLPPKASPEQRAWTACLFKAAACGMTFGQAKQIFRSEMGKFPAGVKPMPDDCHDKGVRDIYPNYYRRAHA